MATHQLKPRGGQPDRSPIATPVRAVGAREPGKARRRARTAAGSLTSRPDGPPGGSRKRQPLYWVGDERDTTQGDW